MMIPLEKLMDILRPYHTSAELLAILDECRKAATPGRNRIGLTGRQKEAFDFIAGRIRETGVAPSYQEIAVAMRLRSKSGAFRLVDALVERGYLRTVPGRARATTVVE